MKWNNGYSSETRIPTKWNSDSMKHTSHRDYRRLWYEVSDCVVILYEVYIRILLKIFVFLLN